MERDFHKKGLDMWVALTGHDPRPAVCELFSGCMELTSQSVTAGLGAMKPYDIVLGDDLLNRDTQNKVLSRLDLEDPALVAVGFPCDPWSPVTNLQNYFAVLEKRRDGEKLLASRSPTAWCATVPSEAGTSCWRTLWHLKRGRTRASSGCERTRFVWFPTRDVTTSIAIASAAALRCPGLEKHSSHGEILGQPAGHSAKAGHWLPAYCRRIFSGLAQQRRLEEMAA